MEVPPFNFKETHSNILVSDTTSELQGSNNVYVFFDS